MISQQPVAADKAAFTPTYNRLHPRAATDQEAARRVGRGRGMVTVTQSDHTGERRPTSSSHSVQRQLKVPGRGCRDRGGFGERCRDGGAVRDLVRSMGCLETEKTFGDGELSEEFGCGEEVKKLAEAVVRRSARRDWGGVEDTGSIC